MTNLLPGKNVTRAIVLLLSVTVLSLIFVFSSKAGNNVQEDFINPDLSFAKIEGTGDYFHWKSQGTLTQSGSEYTLKTNCFACWFEQDSIDFGYKQVKFDYGKEGNLTIETTVKSWNGAVQTASAGIMLRTSLNNDAACVFFGPRPAGVYLLYRYKDGGSFAKGPIAGEPSYPIHLKMVLTGSKATCYYRYSTTDAWIKMSASVPFQYTPGQLYVGIAAHSTDEADLATAVFDGLRVTTDAPDDYVPGESSSSETSTSSAPEENPFPSDLPVTSDILLRETFSDNDMFNTPASVTNPLWKTKVMETTIVTDSEKTNRYLSLFYSDDGYYTAGDRNWTDYSVTADITFPNDYLPEQENTFKFLVRHQDFAPYGYSDYAVIFTGGNKLQIGARNNSANIESAYTILQSTSYTYQDLSASKSFKLRIDAIDNVITVYIDGVQILKATDTTSSTLNTTGCIGFGVKKGYVNIDNVVVRKLSDPVGGDYDNRIGGNFDKPVPGQIQEYSSNNWAY